MSVLHGRDRRLDGGHGADRREAGNRHLACSTASGALHATSPRPSILAQCPTKISFPDPEEREDLLKDAFGYTDAAIRMVKTGMSVKRGGDGKLGARKFLLWRGVQDNGVI